MATYAQLEREPAWSAEYEPPALAAFNGGLRARFGLSRSECGSKGDNRHLHGRHRSRRWCLTSVFCDDRDYGTVDSRDKSGPADALRATDVGITGAALRGATARLLAAKRAGRLPQLAEFFGTVDGTTVTGWFEGRQSSSDSSHLYHLHLGYWTASTDDAVFFAELFDLITGDDMDAPTFARILDDPAVAAKMRALAVTYAGGPLPAGVNVIGALAAMHAAEFRGGSSCGKPVAAEYQSAADGSTASNSIIEQLAELRGELAKVLARPPVQAGPVDPAALKAVLLDPQVLAAIGAAVLDEQHRRDES